MCNVRCFLLTGASAICQAVTLIYPSKDPMMFYFCLGKMHKTYLGKQFKVNWSFNVIAAATALLKFTLSIRLWFFYRKETVGGSSAQQMSIQALIKKKLQQESLFRFQLFFFNAEFYLICPHKANIIIVRT